MPVPSVPVPSAKLILHRDTGTVDQEVPLDHHPYSIGCSLENRLVLEDPLILPHHGEIVWNSDQYIISALTPQAQIQINDQPLNPDVSQPLCNGDRVRIGRTEIQFLETEAAQPGSDPQPGLAGTVVSTPHCEQVLQVTTPQWTQDFPLHQDTLMIGRHPECEIVVDLPVISQRHAQLNRDGDTYTIVDLGSTNGLMVAGEYVTQKRLQDGDVLHISEELTLTYQVIPQTEIAERVETLNLKDLDHLTLGRDPRNDTVIDHPVVSRFHAQIDMQAGSWVITDLHSSNGTFVNSRQIQSQHPLRPGDTIRIGPCHFVFNFDETLSQLNEAGNLRLDALHLTKVVNKSNTLLQDISLSILPQEFVAIVGVSGAGKSTLLDALNGFQPATRGIVLVNEHDLYRDFNAYRTELGYVPQEDIIHQELAVAQALDFSARLRLPADVTPTERARQVQSVLQDLELTHRQHALVKELSGGQRKRVSIGVELLTKPSLFFLDEATSGLDPGTELQMMRLLRRLANQGRTVLLITHATKNVMLCDLVVFLTKGGRIAYLGPPDEALTYFGVKDFDEIYLKVEEGQPEAWDHRYRQSTQYQRYVGDRQRPLAARVGASKDTAARPPRPAAQGVSSWRQWLILSQRNLTILRQDRASLILMLAMAPLLGLLDFILWRPQIFDGSEGDPGQAFTMLFVAVLLPVLAGNLAMMREIVKEGEIYRREHMIGLKILPYVLSKVWLSVVLALYQSAIFLLTKPLSVDLPFGWETAVAMYVTLFLATLGGMVMGLLVSALSSTPNVAPLLTIFFLVPQITFAGAMLPLRTFGWPGQLISQVTVTRWTFESMVTLSGVGHDLAHDPCWQKPEAEREALSEADKESCRCLGPNLFTQCRFPGLNKEYHPAVDQLEPIEPESPGDPPDPAELTLANYQDKLQTYNNKVEAYRQSLEAWQDQFADWKEQRGRAIASGEALLTRFHNNQRGALAVNVGLHWIRMLLLMGAMLGLLLWVQKRKDVI